MPSKLNRFSILDRLAILDWLANLDGFTNLDRLAILDGFTNLNRLNLCLIQEGVAEKLAEKPAKIKIKEDKSILNIKEFKPYV